MKKKLITCHSVKLAEKAAGSSSPLIIEGWANRCIVDRGGDYVPASAWQLENFLKVPTILFNHDTNKPIGKCIAIEKKEDQGLWIKAQISGSADPEISKIRDLIQEGVLNSFSVGFDARHEAKNSEGVNEITDAELFEVSVVTMPMNQDSQFSLATKALSSWLDQAVKCYHEGDKSKGFIPVLKGESKITKGLLAKDPTIREVFTLDALLKACDEEQTDPEKKGDVLVLPKTLFENEEACMAFLSLSDTLEALGSVGENEDKSAWVIDVGVKAEKSEPKPEDEVPIAAPEGPEDLAPMAEEEPKKEDKTVGLSGDEQKVDANPQLDLMKQTNVLLSVLVDKIDGLTKVVSEGLAAASAEEAQENQEEGQEGQEESQEGEDMSALDKMLSQLELLVSHLQG